MLTKWGQTLDKANILPEYPRPQFRRDNCTILNGAWDYAITALSQLTPPERYDGSILVPFSPESELSGVGRALKPNECLWYHRSIEAPAGFDPNTEDLILHFGAVDQFAEVRLNGVTLMHHAGGYLPFSVSLSETFVNGIPNELVVRVRDESDTACWSRGKQSSKPGGIWYTAQSGIWQTVWLERAPKRRIETVVTTPLFDQSAVEFTVWTNCGGAGVLKLLGNETVFISGTPLRLSMEGFTPWSPEEPKLYEFSMTFERDYVESYFAMRKCSVERDEAGIPRLFLNNAPYFHNGVLDQGYWPDGLLTPPSDEALIYDIELMKSLGFNTLRKHIKIEPLRWYYHCDRLDNLEKLLRKECGCEAVIHMDPVETNNTETNRLRTETQTILKELDPRLTLHDFRVVAGPTHTNLVFDVVVPFGFPMADDAVKLAISERIHALEGKCYAVIEIDKSSLRAEE